MLKFLIAIIVISGIVISLIIIKFDLHKRIYYYSYDDDSWDGSGPDAIFHTKRLVIWSNDYHISPINDLKHLLKPLGVKFIDKSFSGHCHITNTCYGQYTLRVINRDNAMDLKDPTLKQR